MSSRVSKYLSAEEVSPTGDEVMDHFARGTGLQNILTPHEWDSFRKCLEGFIGQVDGTFPDFPDGIVRGELSLGRVAAHVDLVDIAEIEPGTFSARFILNFIPPRKDETAKTDTVTFSKGNYHQLRGVLIREMFSVAKEFYADQIYECVRKNPLHRDLELVRALGRADVLGALETWYVSQKNERASSFSELVNLFYDLLSADNVDCTPKCNTEMRERLR